MAYQEDYRAKRCRHGKALVIVPHDDYSTRFGGGWIQETFPGCEHCSLNPPSMPYKPGPIQGTPAVILT